MSETFSLAYLTQLDLPPAQAIAVAARTGYQFVGCACSRCARGHGISLDGRPARTGGDAGSHQKHRAGVFDLELIRLDPTFRASDYYPSSRLAQSLVPRLSSWRGMMPMRRASRPRSQPCAKPARRSASRLISNSCHGRQSPTRAAPRAWSRRLRSQTARSWSMRCTLRDRGRALRMSRPFRATGSTTLRSAMRRLPFRTRLKD